MLLNNAEQRYAFDTGLRLVYGGIRCNPDGSQDTHAGRGGKSGNASSLIQL